jgi:DNA excision repair protein ERCC-2
MDTYNLSIRQLVEFTLRNGDIDTAYMSQNRALDGTRVHQRIQKQRKKEAKTMDFTYQSEVVLDFFCEYKGIIFQLSGRADGLQIAYDGNITLEEIKSTLAPLELLQVADSHWHWAQAKCYGYMYLASLDDENEQTGLTVALTYGQIETENVRSFTRYCSLEDLYAFFYGLLDRYWAYADMDLNRVRERNDTARLLAFPFGAYRPGQREMAVSVFAAIKQKRRLFTQAPTGIGKTISVLFPAVKSLSEGFGVKIFYLTAKVIARQVAEEAFRLMAEKGLRMRVITLTAGDKICFQETRKCDPLYCPYANGHFDRVNEAILDIVTNELVITRSSVEAYAGKHRVCPREFQLDVSLFCDAVICDYNHAYDPKAKLQRFFSFGGDYILLNDEAHNLLERARDMFSAGLYRRDFMDLRKAVGRRHPLYKGLKEIANKIRECWDTERDAFCRDGHPAELQALLFVFAQLCDEVLAQNENDPNTEALLTIYFNVLDYLRVSEIYDQRYAFFCEPAAGYIRLYCLDPSYLLAQAQKKTRACVFFSATLTPLDYFRTLLGGEPDDYTLRLASPFPRENLCLLVDDRISTRYRDRALSYETIADRLAVLVTAHTGNYMAFFPSYVYLNEVYTMFSDKYPTIKTLVQSQDMDDENREGFLVEFKENPRETLLAFTVMGGVFSEGIDLKGERLSGAAIIGVGLPMVCARRNVLLDYFNREGIGNGFAFAYIYPGMNKVMQASGRVIRTETDRGAVLLIDNRFTESDYRKLFPPEWDGYGIVRNEGNLVKSLEMFWGNGG